MTSRPGTGGLHWLRLLGLGGLVCALYLWLDDFALLRMASYQAQRPEVGRPLFNAAAYAGTYLLGLLSLVLLQCHDRAWLRIPSQILAWVCIAAHLSLLAIHGRGFTTTEANLFWGEIEYLPGALAFFLWDCLPALIATALGILAFEWLVRRFPTGLRSAWVLLLPVIAGAGALQLLVRTDSMVEQFPLTVKAPVLVAYAFFHQSVYTGERDPVALSPEHAPLAPHIVFVMDESIRGDLLSVNGGPYPTTPYLEEISQRLLNYGVASSVANLSAPANIIVQSGLRPEQLPDVELRSMKNPSIFDYMRAAGYRTGFVNAQNALPRPPNFMTDADVSGLDHAVNVREKFPGLEDHAVDHAIPGLIADQVQRFPRTFTYVLKNGAHFPYAPRFPTRQRHFDPEPWRATHGERESQIIADYLDTLRWTVDDFMRELVEELEPHGPGILIVYSADHGQSLWEERAQGQTPLRGHGQYDRPPSEQARIPLFLLALDPALHSRLARLHDPALRDRVSAFEIFSSLLRLGGYSEQALSGRYTPSIFDPGADRSQRVFVSGNHFGADGPLYRDAPYRSSFTLNTYEPHEP